MSNTDERTLGKKVLCLCQKGNSRSVALAWMLKVRGYDALAAGLVTSSTETISMLCEWADTVIITDKKLIRFLPDRFAGKSRLWDVGTDRWFKGFSRDLIARFEVYLNA